MGNIDTERDPTVTYTTTVYTLPNCPQCDLTKRALQKSEISFVIIDLDTNHHALAMVKQLGFASAPVVIGITGSWAGFRPDLIASLAAEVTS